MSAPVRLNVKRQPRTVAPTKASVLVLQSNDKKCRVQANSKTIGFTRLRPCDIKRLFFESHLLCMAGASKVSMQVLASTHGLCQWIFPQCEVCAVSWCPSAWHCVDGKGKLQNDLWPPSCCFCHKGTRIFAVKWRGLKPRRTSLCISAYARIRSACALPLKASRRHLEQALPQGNRSQTK